jgi:iron transport multicopper oxidase
MYQKGSPAYDGGVGTSQCPIYHGDAFTYTFKADPPGTSWYHAHEKGQYPDGLRGMLIVHDPEWEKSLDIDEQISLTMSDWYHTEHTYLINDYLSPDNTDGDIPSPDCFLFNDTRSGPTFDFEREKRYLIRLVSMASLVCGDFHIEDHTLSVVGVDGIHTKPHTTKAIRVCPGQRYDVVVEGKSSSDRKDSFNWIAKMDTTMLRSNFPPDDKLSVIGNVDYRSRGKYRRRRKSKGLKPSWKAKAKDVLDDTELKPLDETPLFGPVNRRITLRTNQSYYDGLGTRIGTGGQPWAEPKVPTLYTALSTGDAAFHPATYGWGVDPHVLRWDEVVEIYMENSQERPHPMHIHGTTTLQCPSPIDHEGEMLADSQ